MCIEILALVYMTFKAGYDKSNMLSFFHPRIHFVQCKMRIGGNKWMVLQANTILIFLISIVFNDFFFTFILIILV